MKHSRFLSLLLILCLLLCFAPAALAEEPEAAPPADEPQDEQLTGFFLVGSMNGWTPSEAYRFTWNAYNESTGVEFIFLCHLNVGDEFKAVQVDNGVTTWFPDGANNNYVVDAAHAGDKAVYFRPQYQSDWGGHFLVEDPPAPQAYHVSTKVNSPVHGSISVSPEDAYEGDPVTVTVTPDEGYILSYIEAPSIVKVNDSTYSFQMPGYDTTVYATFKLAPGFYFDNTGRVVPDDYVPEEKFSPSSSPFGEWERETVLTADQYLDVNAVYAPERASERTGYYWCFQTMKLTYSSSDSRPKVTAEQAGHAMVFLTETEREGYIKAIHLERTYMDPSFVWDAWITIKNFHPIHIAAAEHGTVTAPADAYESQLIPLTVTPEEGYELDALTVLNAEGQEIPVENEAFAMPDTAVTVTAAFRETAVQIDYPLWLGETRVTSLNRDDILDDGTVSFDPSTGTLRFEDAEPAIQGLHENALLYADGMDLTIEAPQGLRLNTDAENSCGIRMPSGDLTVNGDLEIRSSYINVYAGNTAFVLNGDLDLAGGVNGLNCAGIEIHGSVEAFSDRNVLYAGDGQLQITGDRIHVVSTDGSNTSMGLYGYRGVTLNGTVEVESVDDCISAPYSQATINGDATLVSSKGNGIVAFDVLLNGSLNAETSHHGIDGKIGGGSVRITGSVNGVCTNQYPYYAVIHGEDITVEGDVTAQSRGYGILAENGGGVTMVSGTWTLDGGKSALQAKGGISIPDTHAIVSPAGGQVSQVGGNYCITQADGSTVATYAVIRVPAEDYAEVAGISISAEGNIGLHIYLYLPESVADDPDAYVTMDGERFPVSQAVTQPVNGRSAHRFSVAVPAKEMGRKVTLRVFNGQDQLVDLRGGGQDLTETGLVYAVRDYLDTVVSQEPEGALKELCIAMRDYGSCAQAVFHYDEENRPALLNDLSGIGAADLAAFQPLVDETGGSGLQYVSSTLLLRSETTVRHYFRLSRGEIADFSFTLDGKSLSPFENQGYWCVDVPNISARNLSQMPVLTVTRGGEACCTVTFGPLSYGWNAFRLSESAPLLDLVRAMLLYARAAEAYFA